MEILSDDTINWLQETFFERQVSREEFEELTKAEELHQVVDNYNWDEGPELLQWIIESPLCDKGTALLIFWRANPVYHTQYSEDPKNWNSGGYQLVQAVLKKWQENGFSQGIIAYDPEKDYAAETDEEERGAWSIPADMRNATPGEPWPDYDELYPYI